MTTWAVRRAELDRRVAASSAAVAAAMRDAGDLAGAAVYRSEAARLEREVEAVAGDRQRTLDRVRELLVDADAAESVAAEVQHDPDDDPRLCPGGPADAGGRPRAAPVAGPVESGEIRPLSAAAAPWWCRGVPLDVLRRAWRRLSARDPARFSFAETLRSTGVTRPHERVTKFGAA